MYVSAKKLIHVVFQFLVAQFELEVVYSSAAPSSLWSKILFMTLVVDIFFKFFLWRKTENSKFHQTTNALITIRFIRQQIQWGSQLVTPTEGEFAAQPTMQPTAAAPMLTFNSTLSLQTFLLETPATHVLPLTTFSNGIPTHRKFPFQHFWHRFGVCYLLFVVKVWFTLDWLLSYWVKC